MTSFNINGPSKMPQVTEAQNMMNNGGGGNTGYLETGRKKKKKKEEEFDPSILADEGEDKFERSEIEYEDDDEYYGRNSSQKTTDDKTPSKEKPKEALKNKILGFVWNMVNNEKQEETVQTYKSGDFLSFSSKKDNE